MTPIRRAFLLALIAAAAFAHHSNAGFSPDAVREISGTVKEFQFRHPHSWIQVLVTDAAGKVTEWSVEWGSPNQLGREGIRPTTFTPGMALSIKLHPILNGSPVGGFIGAKLSNGKIIGKWDHGE